jgi:hypothetical protein
MRDSLCMAFQRRPVAVATDRRNSPEFRRRRPAGAGASGGSVYGGALFVGGATLINVTLSTDSAVGGFGSYGGIYFDPNENPVGESGLMAGCRRCWAARPAFRPSMPATTTSAQAA